MNKTTARKLERAYAKRVQKARDMAKLHYRHGELEIGADYEDQAQFFESLRKSYERRSR